MLYITFQLYTLKNTKCFILFSDLQDFLLPLARFYCTFILGVAVVVTETAAIWHEFVLYEDFVLYRMAEQLNKLHNTFGVFSRRLGLRAEYRVSQQH